MNTPTPRTDAVYKECVSNPNPGNGLVLAEHARQLERELSEAKEKLDYVEKIGLRFGMMKSSDKPEPYLAHTWAEDSDHERMFREWSATVGRKEQCEQLRAEVERLKKSRELLEGVAGENILLVAANKLQKRQRDQWRECAELAISGMRKYYELYSAAAGLTGFCYTMKHVHYARENYSKALAAYEQLKGTK